MKAEVAALAAGKPVPAKVAGKFAKALAAANASRKRPAAAIAAGAAAKDAPAIAAIPAEDPTVAIAVPAKAAAVVPAKPMSKAPPPPKIKVPPKDKPPKKEKVPKVKMPPKAKVPPKVGPPKAAPKAKVVAKAPAPWDPEKMLLLQPLEGKFTNDTKELFLQLQLVLPDVAEQIRICLKEDKWCATLSQEDQDSTVQVHLKGKGGWYITNVTPENAVHAPKKQTNAQKGVPRSQ